MEWFEPFGTAIIALIMIPNIIFAIKCRDGFANAWSNKAVELLEQAGRFGCFAMMILNIPFVSFGFSSDGAFTVYLIANGVMVLAYCAIWAVCFRKSSMFRAVALSVIPSVIFIFSGIISRDIPLIVMALIFAPCHILISCKNAAA